VSKLRYQFRFYPTTEQVSLLAKTFGCCRYVYNWALRFRTDSYQAGKTVNYNDSSKALTELKTKPETEWLNEVSSVPVQQSLRHLQTAFKNFFDKRSKYPTFKKRRNDQSAEYTTSAFKWDAITRSLNFAKLGNLNIRWSRTFKSQPTTATISKRADGRYFVTLVLDEQIKQLPKTCKEVGIDLGINRLATLSTGEQVVNPKLLKVKTRKLARAQRILSRRKSGSNRRERQCIRVARLHSRIVDARLDYIHKATTDIVRRFDTFCVEDLNVRGMVKNHCLARSLSDASMGQFVRLLEYKCAWYGKTLVKIDRFFPSSKRCSKCGHIVESLPLSVRSWVCPECGAKHDRDLNAAINILAAGRAVTAQGGGVSRVKPLGLKRNRRGTVNWEQHA